ncbi:MAG TPA: hypothetical protein P5323_02730 [Candidatus Moranbacteria bacterium]|nr:hypothetical protein [Candidatus Moranbacteria bacterium]HRY28028.1 hypothetical protein [Candidatus Moranbacteria bacterium]HSA07897.1 hypothetical protein [Candidatus Moranbacteria bacterium]
MIITLPPFSQRGTNVVMRIKLMIELANFFKELTTQIEFSDKFSDIILFHITGNDNEIDIWNFVKKKKNLIEKKLNGQPAKVIAGKKRMILNHQQEEYNGSRKENTNTSLYKTVC